MKNKGSLTVEATLAATVFICIMLVLLSMVKLVLIEYTLSYSAYESAKSIADVSYFVNLINDIQEDMDENYDASVVEQAENLGEYSINTASSLTQKLLSYGMSNKDKKADAKLVTGLSKTGIQTVLDLGKQVGTNLYGANRDAINTLKKSQKNNFVKEIISETIDERGINIDKDKVMIEIVKFPETNREYTINSVNLNYIKNGLYSGRDFDKDDAVVVLSYKAKIDVPFINSYEFTIRKIAIEKGWVNGDNGVITKFSAEGLLDRGISRIITVVSNYATQNDVYIVNNSAVYHHSRSCGKIGDKHTTKLKEYVAKDNGYRACSSCQ